MTVTPILVEPTRACNTVLIMRTTILTSDTLVLVS